MKKRIKEINMKNELNLENQNSKHESIIQHALKTGGFLFPESVEEVEAFERAFGSTDFILPEELQEPVFLYASDIEVSKACLANNELIAMAAREGKDLPDHIKIKMKREREEARHKNKFNNG